MLGILGIVYEAASGLERPTLLILYATMIGVPDMVAHDRDNERKRRESHR